MVLETDYDFYEWPHALKEWLNLNDRYFLDLNTLPQLMPRGLLLGGEPGGQVHGGEGLGQALGRAVVPAGCEHEPESVSG